MVLLQNCSISSVFICDGRSRNSMEKAVTRGCKINYGVVHRFFFRRNTKSAIRCSSINADTQIAEILQNKVLITAAASAAIGQLLKPFTSVLLRSKSSFDFKAAVRAGGFPSTHSSAVVATATTLGFERGFSDPIFGLAVVYACLIMYDAQGVRREVGNHAKAINKVFSRNKLEEVSSLTDANNLADSFLGIPSNSESSEPLFLEKLKPSRFWPTKSQDRTESTARKNTSVPDVKKLESDSFLYAHLKEAVGHTEIEVVAGALLGFFVSIAFYTGYI